MKKVIELTKIFLKTSFSSINMKMGISTNGKNKILPKIAYIFLFLYLSAIIVFISYQMIQGLQMIQQAGVFVGLILISILGVTTVQTIFSSINILYFTKDNEYILPLPLKPYQIILARTNVLIIMEYLIEILIGLIPLSLYGILTGMGFSYYIGMVIALLCLPILPILLVSIIVMFVMSFARLTKNKNRFQLIATLLVMIIAIGFSFAISGIDKEMSHEEMAQMLVQANGMVDMIKGYFPTLDYITTALTSQSIVTMSLEMIKAIAITLLGFAVYLWAAEKIYFKGLVGNLFGGTKKKVVSKLEQKQFQNRKRYKSYIAKEFKILIRTPVFLMQCLLPAVLMPVLLVGLLSMQIASLEEVTGMTQMITTIKTDSFVVSAILLGIIQFFSMFIYVAITAVSRDGKNAVFMKYIPISLYQQYRYKIMPNIILNGIVILITLIMAQVLLHLPIAILLILFVVAMIMGILQSILMLIVDLKRPKLEWDSEYAVAKQNLNLVFPVLLAIVNIMIMVGLGFLLKEANVYLGLFITGVIFGLITFRSNRYLYKNQDKLANKII